MTKTIVITGGSDGIGAAAARALCNQGHRVVIVGRSASKTAKVAQELEVPFHIADFSSLDQVRGLGEDLASAHSRIDVLANNAGGMMNEIRTTADGFEATFQVNHLAPFLLTHVLMDTLQRSNATVIQTASVAARLKGRLDLTDLERPQGSTTFRVYGAAKLANILFTSELNRRFGDRGIATASFHPGVVASSFGLDITSSPMGPLLANPLVRRIVRTPEQGADQLVWLATTAPGEEWISGGYYEKRRQPRKVNTQATDPAAAAALWDRSEEMLAAHLMR